MSSSSRTEIGEVFDALHAVVDRLLGLSFDELTTPERLRLLGRLETESRRLPVPGHALINQIARQATPAEIGGRLSSVLAERLHISRADAHRRIGEATDLGSRQTLTGQPLPPLLQGAAAAQRDGTIGRDHISIIRGFCHRLPSAVDAPAAARAEQELAGHARNFGPEHTARLADKLTDCLNPDGTYTDEDRARRRGLSLGKQQPDGMSELRGWCDPQLRATLEAVFAKLAAPGMANPDDPTPTVDGDPSQAAIDADTRSSGQRHHDALIAALRALLASGDLGHHNRLPTSIIVTTTLTELEAAAGRGLTGGGTLLPMSDVIRLAGHAHHYLAIFDGAKTLALHHTKRLASPAQRLVLYAKDRGCTHPGCPVAGYFCEAHHSTDYAQCRRTNVDELTFRCGGHHRLIKPGGYTTRKRHNGIIETIPPAHADHGQPRTNTYHHPEKLLHRAGDSEDVDDP